MQEMIETLIEKGHAYTAKDGTVYSAPVFKGYGKLSHKNLEDLQSGFREIKVTGEEDKEDPTDFVLWKPKKDGEPFWESPWCQGRPAGISSAPLCPRNIWESPLISMQAEKIWYSHTTRTRSPRARRPMESRLRPTWMHNDIFKY